MTPDKEVGLKTTTFPETTNTWQYHQDRDISCDHDYARSVAELAPNIRFCCFCGEKL